MKEALHLLPKTRVESGISSHGLAREAIEQPSRALRAYVAPHQKSYLEACVAPPLLLTENSQPGDSIKAAKRYNT